MNLLKRSDGRSNFWVACFTDSSGRRLKKSTKTANRGLAMEMGVKWEAAVQAGKAGRLVESQMRKVLSEIVERATGEKPHFHSCREWFEEWLNGKCGATADATLKKYRQVCKDFLAHLGERAGLPLPSISTRDVRSFRDVLLAKGLAAPTINSHVRQIIAIPFIAAQKLRPQ